MNNHYWFSTPWISKCKGLKKLLGICNKNLISIEDIINHKYKLDLCIYKNIKVIDIYLMDLYCLNTIGQPAFFISKEELNKVDIKILNNIRSSSYLLIDTITSSIYGDIEGRKQVNYLLKWNNLNLILLSSIWSNYNLKDKYPLNRCEVDLHKIRETYLRCLSLANGIGNKVESKTAAVRQIESDISNNLINSLLNN